MPLRQTNRGSKDIRLSHEQDIQDFVDNRGENNVRKLMDIIQSTENEQAIENGLNLLL